MTMVDGPNRWLYYVAITISLFALTVPWLFFYPIKHLENNQANILRNDVISVLRKYLLQDPMSRA
jgi:hypothetical protein